MSSRLGWGEDGIFFEHDALCRDRDRHRHCEGRWRGVVSLGFGPDGKRIRRKVSGKTKTMVQDRLKALLPSWMPWIRKRYRLSAKLEQQLQVMSARQMDRRLESRKRQQKRKIYGRTKPGVLLKHHIPIKTDSWDVKAPGFTEVDFGFPFGQFGRWGICSYPEPDGHTHGLDRIAGVVGKRTKLRCRKR